MARYTETTLEKLWLEDAETKEAYEVEVEVTRIELRKGNYSSAALDPDEYFGEWATTIEINGADYYKEDGNEYVDWLDYSELPQWVIDETEIEFED
jgi:hypothetical protein